jgi:hypothetical protein
VFKLETKNRGDLLERVPALPLTFEDAIVATRRLGARYIWIDSLCIIQDDPADWERESSSMADVYRNATCNIAASAAHDSNGGLYRDRGDIVPGIYVKSSGDDKTTLLLIRADEGIEHEEQESPLQRVSPQTRSFFSTREYASNEKCRGVGYCKKGSSPLGSYTSHADNLSGSAMKLWPQKAFQQASLEPGHYNISQGA